MPSTEPRAGGARRLVRIVAVLLAIAGPLVVWTVATPVLGVVVAVQLTPGAAPQTVSPLTVAIVSALAGLVAWGLLALLERTTAHPRAIWTALSIVVLVLSLAGPLSAAANPSAKIALTCMHLAVAIALLALASTGARTASPERRLGASET